MGKPTVATSTHTMRDIFATYTHLASNEKNGLPPLISLCLKLETVHWSKNV